MDIKVDLSFCSLHWNCYVNIYVKYLYIDLYFHFSWIKPLVEMAGLYSESVFNLLRNCQTVCQVVVLFYISISNVVVPVPRYLCYTLLNIDCSLNKIDLS